MLEAVGEPNIVPPKADIAVSKTVTGVFDSAGTASIATQQHIRSLFC
jgi:hypothetical protein